MVELVGVLYFGFAFSFLWWHYNRFGLTPVLVFVIMQCTMFLGIALLADSYRTANLELLYIYLAALALFCSGAALASPTSVKFSQKRLQLQRYLNAPQAQILLFVAVIAIGVCLWFTLRAGGNVFAMMLQSLSRGGSTDFSRQRAQFTYTAGSGYVYQFRVFLLPVITAYLISCERSLLRRIGFLLFPVMILFLLATGQRGGFVIFVLMWLAGIHNLSATRWFGNVALRDRRRARKAYVAIAVAFTTLFAVLTYYNGRHVASGGISAAIVDRLFHDNQLTALVAFEYITTLKTQYGQDWLAMFMDLLPGENVYVTLSMQVHGILWGSMRGSAPPCIWGSAYYNWGMLGILAMPLSLGYLYQRLHNYCIANATSRFDLFLYSALTISLGTWVADSPIGLLTDGSLALVVLWGMVALARSPKLPGPR